MAHVPRLCRICRIRHSTARRLRMMAAVATLCLTGTASAIDLADTPLFATNLAPGNLLLALSVEYPTASTEAYSAAYSSTTTYLGYFDAAKCYQYTAVNTGTGASPDYSTSYFAPYSITSDHTCTSTATRPLWSGNYLNWATTQTLDAFRWALTGGNRAVDTSTQTILVKTLHKNNEYFENKTLSAGISGATPFSWGSVSTRMRGLGAKMRFTASGSLNSTGSNYTGQSSLAGTADGTKVYELYVRVKVCDSAVGLESNCKAYTGVYKPEGLMQTYAQKLRYSAFGYLSDDAGTRDGGVMRSRMKYIGPTRPVPGSTAVTNSVAEWDGSTGVLTSNPDSSDATDTANWVQSSTGLSVSITNSGVMNYLNKFGQGYPNSNYKSYDPVSELYYAGLRYYRNLGNVAAYSSLGAPASAAAAKQLIDDFPVITTWDDPIAYSCQKNFILGIGDIYSWNDANLQGSTIRGGSEPTMPAEVAADTAINVKTATDMVGQLEGRTGLGSYSSGRSNSYFITGLAYHAHTNDLRSDLSGSQTINTYWVDVLENPYESKNQYWLAAKYGGFEVPSGFVPYAASNGASTLASSTWRSTTDTVGSDPRPDNYFTGGQADKIVSGLSTAFAKIASEAGATASTAFASVSPNEATSGSASYSSTYNPSNWSSTLTASTVAYDSSGNPTLTSVWEAGALLDGTAAANRKIVTCCTSAGAALPFTNASLSAATLSSRTYWSSFAAVTGVASGSQSAANFLDYLRGDRSNERSNGGPYRTRGHVLGDIVNAKLTVVGPPDATYYDTTNPGYKAFKRSQASRKTVVYAAANDGMLHAFDGRLSGTGAGNELFAYIPSFTYGDASTAATSGLAALGNPNFSHHFYVDATPQVFDVDLALTGGTTSSSTHSWRSLLIGGLGRGGKGWYAIDVTDPTAWDTEAHVAEKVLWEFTHTHMGYSYGDARVIKTARHGWVAVIPSGYNNDDGKGYLFFVNPATGALLDTVVTTTGSTSAPINLAHVTAFIPDLTDYTATALYAGDMQGNIWRVDISAAHGNYPNPVRIATLATAGGTAQPVTTPVRVMVDPSTGKRYVLAGTGRLLAESDIASTQVQTLYAIADGTTDSFYTTSTLPTGASFPITRSQLNANTSLLTGIGSAPASAMGWYFDLGADATTSIAERVNVAPTVNNGIVGFAINLPNGQACSPSGSSRVIAVSFATGKTVLTDSSGALIASTSSSSGIATDIAFKNVGGRIRLIAGRSSGAVSNLPGSFGGAAGLRRMNWREVPIAQ